jgi:hypothetical protein
MNLFPVCEYGDRKTISEQQKTMCRRRSAEFRIREPNRIVRILLVKIDRNPHSNPFNRFHYTPCFLCEKKKKVHVFDFPF